MIDGRGYPYFVDFRFSKSFIDEGENAPSARTFTLCGTPEYVSVCLLSIYIVATLTQVSVTCVLGTCRRNKLVPQGTDLNLIGGHLACLFMR